MVSTPEDEFAIEDGDEDHNEGKDIKLTPKEYLDLIKFHNDPKGPLKYYIFEPLTPLTKKS
tara:strand:- start:63 stop:245 length:183 start_codon:yes stop_codon:yes gene_type:complete